MTPTKFKALKDRTTRIMTRQLQLAQQQNRPTQPYTAQTGINIYSHHHDQDTALETLKLVQEAMLERPDSKLTTRAITKWENCTNKPLGIEYQISYPIIRDEILPEQVEAVMRSHIKNKLNLGTWDELNCRIMDLFKRDLIDWAEVEKAHKGDCQL